MTISVISFWIPLIWALLITSYWRFKIKAPYNNWWACAFVLAINFFWFAYAIVVFLLVAVINSLTKK